jgi:hypothetical protein
MHDLWLSGQSSLGRKPDPIVVSKVESTTGLLPPLIPLPSVTGSLDPPESLAQVKAIMDMTSLLVGFYEN